MKRESGLTNYFQKHSGCIDASTSRSHEDIHEGHEFICVIQDTGANPLRGSLVVMPRSSQPSRPPPGEGSVQLPPSDGDSLLIERLASRVRRLEAVIQSMEQQLVLQLRRTDEIQAQLDRAITEVRLKR